MKTYPREEKHLFMTHADRETESAPVCLCHVQFHYLSYVLSPRTHDGQKNESDTENRKLMMSWNSPER